MKYLFCNTRIDCIYRYPILLMQLQYPSRTSQEQKQSRPQPARKTIKTDYKMDNEENI